MAATILPSGFDDLERGSDFYDRRSEGLGRDFLRTVFAAIESLEGSLAVHKKVYGYHRLLVQRFPYVVYYKVEDGKAVVYRVLDCRSDPKRHREALE